MENKLLTTNIIIHGFAVLHAAVAATLAQTMVGDEIALTTLTVTMIIAISRLYKQPVEVGSAFAFLGIFAGFYLGTRGAMMLVKWIPGIGNAANAMATTVTTEVLGWATYCVVSRNRSVKDVEKGEADELIKAGKRARKENAEKQKRIEETIKKMSNSDKAYYNSLMEELKKKDLSEQEQANITLKIESLFNKYGLY